MTDTTLPTFKVAVDAYITFRGHAKTKEEFEDRVIEFLWESLKANGDAIDWETKIDFSVGLD